MKQVNYYLTILVLISTTLPSFSQKKRQPALIPVDVYVSSSAININGLVRECRPRSLFTVSPDRQFIAFLLKRNEKTQGHLLEKGLYLYTTAKKELVLVTPVSPGISNGSIEWSPSGQFFIAPLSPGPKKLLFDPAAKKPLGTVSAVSNKYFWLDNDTFVYQYRTSAFSNECGRNNGYCYGIKQFSPGKKATALFPAGLHHDHRIAGKKGETLRIVHSRYEKDGQAKKQALIWKEIIIINNRAEIIKKRPRLKGRVCVRTAAIHAAPSPKSRKISAAGQGRLLTITGISSKQYTRDRQQARCYRIRLNKKISGWCFGKDLALQ